MTTPDLVRQILAAIEATERDAQTAAKVGGASWSVEAFTPSSPEALPAVVWVVDEAEDGMAMVNGDRRARHIARHDPASVLRRCAADQKLVQLHAGPHECADDDYTNRADHCAVIALLADAYGVTPDRGGAR